MKSDEGVLMGLLFPMSETFINWGDTSNLVQGAGPASLPFGHRALTPSQPGWYWGQPHLLPYTQHGTENPNRQDGEKKDNRKITGIAFAQLLILDPFFF